MVCIVLVVSCKLSVISYKLVVISYKLAVISWQMLRFEMRGAEAGRLRSMINRFRGAL